MLMEFPPAPPTKAFSTARWFLRRCWEFFQCLPIYSLQRLLFYLGVFDHHENHCLFGFCKTLRPLQPFQHFFGISPRWKSVDHFTGHIGTLRFLFTKAFSFFSRLETIDSSPSLLVNESCRPGHFYYFHVFEDAA